jgi:hypothetical protein
MNQEISGLSGTNRLTSKPRASMERVAPEPSQGVESSQETKEVKKFEVEMKLVNEIHRSLEAFLKNLSPLE